jgi:hypothetical protein
VLADEQGDWLREAVAFLADPLMEAEVEQICGAGYRERSPGLTGPTSAAATGRGRCGRGSARSSWRARSCARARTSPSFLAPRKMSEQAPRGGAGCLRAGGARQRRLDAQG